MSSLNEVKHLHFPEIIVCQCPNNPKLHFSNKSVHQRKKMDLDQIISKIQELINDSVFCNNDSRICSLLYDFLHENGEQGFNIRHLSTILDLLEFFSWKAREMKDYLIHLDRLLEICCQPLLLKNFSASFSSIEIIEQYFTTLGYLLIILPAEEQILKVYRALSRLLFQSKIIVRSTVPMEIYHQAMEKSKLPVILTRLLQLPPSVIYTRTLDLCFILVSVSSVCCRIFLQAGILQHLLVRLHPSYEPGLRVKPPNKNSDLNLDKEDYYEEMILVTNIIWSLVKITFPLGKNCPNAKKLPTLSEDALWSFRCAFRREILRSQRSSKSIMMRNDLACLIFAGTVALPFWEVELVRSGLADDIVVILATEVQSVSSWASDVKLECTKEDLFFKKILLLFLSYIFQSEASIIDKFPLPAVLCFINPDILKSSALISTSQFWYLAQYAMNTLNFLAQKMSLEFLKQEVPLRLIVMLESMSVEFEITIAMHLVKTICSIVSNCSGIILKDFREKGIVISVTKLIHKILNIDNLSMQHQRLLTHLIIIMQETMKNNKHLQEIYGDENIKLILRLLQRFHEKKGKFLFDQRILISIGSFIWQCIKYPSNVKNLIKTGAIYLLLDIIEGASFSVRCVYLGLLSEMCQVTFCGSHLCTWRGVDKTKGFISLLAETWREEENFIGVKRTSEGCIEDLELPLIGEEQKNATYNCNQSHDSSPALIDMIGSVRPKIYSIVNIMNEEIDKYEKIKDHYKILIDDITTEDLITLCIVENYHHLKKGEVWVEVSRVLQESGVQPVEMDGQKVSAIIQQYQKLAMDVKEKQEKILKEQHKKEKAMEMEKFSRIRNSTLVSSLLALREIDFIRKTTDKNYKSEQGYRQRQFIEKSLNFPPGADEKYCHRMFHNFMHISRLSHTIHDPEMAYLDTDYQKDLPPVSP